MKFHRITRGLNLLIFLALLFFASYPLKEGLAVDLFLRMDPLAALGTVVASHRIPAYFIPALIVLVGTAIMGRFFCGHICPMGTTLDVLETVVSVKKPAPEKNSNETTGAYRSIKFIVLTVVTFSAIGGVSLVFIGSPISLITRFYGLVIGPILLVTGDFALQATAPLADKIYPDLVYMELVQKVFASNYFVFGFFVGLTALAYFQPRFWCRHLCPAGALMGLFARRSIFRRRVSEACTRCGKCVRQCPTAAISGDAGGTAFSECIMCLECENVCPVGAISFSPHRAGTAADLPADFTRRSIVLGAANGLVIAGLMRTSLNQPRPLGKERAFTASDLIRPPGALPEPEFLSRCIRCGECMKACATNTLQPVWLKSGLEGIFSPEMVLRLAACSINCNVCGKVCPTGAIRDLTLTEKQHAKIGTAWIARQNCLVWEQDKKCLVCDEVCPFKAISFRAVEGLENIAPFVEENKCLGCGWCETKCPVEGGAAIKVNIIGEVRLSSGSYIEKGRELGLVFKARESSSGYPDYGNGSE